MICKGKDQATFTREAPSFMPTQQAESYDWWLDHIAFRAFATLKKLTFSLTHTPKKTYNLEPMSQIWGHFEVEVLKKFFFLVLRSTEISDMLFFQVWTVKLGLEMTSLWLKLGGMCISAPWNTCGSWKCALKMNLGQKNGNNYSYTKSLFASDVKIATFALLFLKYLSCFAYLGSQQ